MSSSSWIVSSTWVDSQFVSRLVQFWQAPSIVSPIRNFLFANGVEITLPAPLAVVHPLLRDLGASPQVLRRVDHAGTEILNANAFADQIVKFAFASAGGLIPTSKASFVMVLVEITGPRGRYVEDIDSRRTGGRCIVSVGVVPRYRVSNDHDYATLRLAARCR
jgi:hypothetical protein